jgi:hypothetical protein
MRTRSVLRLGSVDALDCDARMTRLRTCFADSKSPATIRNACRAR